MTNFEAINYFWNSFGVPAYDETTVPDMGDKPNYPYITYEAGVGYLNDNLPLSASIWDYGTSWIKCSELADRISNALGVGGKTIQYDNGVMWVKRGNPFAQRTNDRNSSSGIDVIRRLYISIDVEFLTNK